MIETRTDLSVALAAFSRAGRLLAGDAELDPILAELVEAAARGTGAELAAVWLPDRAGTLVARAVWASSGSLAAELDGRRTESVETAATLVAARFEGEVETLSIPFDADGTTAMLELVRRGGPFDRRVDARRVTRSRPHCTRGPALRGRARRCA